MPAAGLVLRPPLARLDAKFGQYQAVMHSLLYELSSGLRTLLVSGDR
jgi:hypothetical protein